MRLLLVVLLLPAALQAEEWWAWSMLDLWREAPWSTGVFLGNRLDVDDDAYVQIISPRAKYQALPWLEAGIGLSLLSIENTRTHMRYWQGRPELELNPRFNLTPCIRLDIRNRMEWRLNEGDAFTTNRTRHRLQLAWTLPQPLRPLTRVFASNEWLIDLHRRQWTENRLVPLGLTFKLTNHSDLDLFYMLLSQHGKNGWEGESVLGTYLRIRF
ncbi:MAG: DUF2490 domain-containing protein [Verrucomicrobiaceae bacterium]|nr:DUF2490 domain-containing protein [Verrucomicrobiaceae bacterium]